MNTNPYRLYLIFLKIGFLMVGGAYGGVALYDKILREDYGLINREFFEETLSIASAVPGPITVNMAVIIGYKLNGYFGALMSLLGLLTPSIALSLTLATLIHLFRDNLWFKLIVRGMVLILIGILILTTLELILKHTVEAGNLGKAILSVFLITLAIVTVKFLKLPLLVALGLSVAISILAYVTLGI